jgi:dTDP-4-amino-4,6-dideoxygalactose transaminase
MANTRVAERSSVADIPAEDLTRQHAGIADELRAAFERVLPQGRYTMGQNLAAFEMDFARYVGSRHAIGISSGTAALHLALRALGVGPHDEVITVPNTYVATVFAITYTGATPVFVDVDPTSYNIDPAEVAKAVNDRTKAVLPVHLYGRCVDADAVQEAAQGIPILEDAAHAHGATYKGRKAGSLGDMAAFSFYPSKVLGALGDGGAITTSDDELASRIRQLRYMGQAGEKHDHQTLGYQERLDEMQAAFLSVKLRHLDHQVARRNQVADRYDEMLAATPVRLPDRGNDGRHAFYMYSILAPDRDALRDFLEGQGIGTQIIYPRLVPEQRAYDGRPWRAVGELAVARSLVAQLLCLPMFAELSDKEVDRVGTGVREFYGIS